MIHLGQTEKLETPIGYIDFSEDSELGKELRKKCKEIEISVDQLQRLFNGEEVIHPVFGKMDIWYLRRKEEK